MESRIIWVTLVIWFVVLLGIAVFNWSYLIDKDEQLRNLGLLAAALMGAPLVIWRMAVVHRDVQIKEFDSIIGSNEVAASSYKQAIELLGAYESEDKPDIQLRLSGIYELERLAKKNKDYRHQILRMLTSYVRQQAPIPIRNLGLLDEPSKYIYHQHHLLEPREDIQAIFHVFSGSSASWVKGFGQLDFSFCHLVRISFKPDGLDCNFASADLSDGKFERSRFNASTTFKDCKLANAVFFFSDLSACHWSGADLEDTEFRYADIRRGYGFTEKQLSAAKSLYLTHRDPHLACSQPFPNFDFGSRKAYIAHLEIRPTTVHYVPRSLWRRLKSILIWFKWR